MISTYDLFGWVGAFFIIFSYMLFSKRKLKVDYTLFHMLNFFGFMGLALSTYMAEAWPALTLSLVFVTISIVYIVKILSIKPSYKEFRLE